LALVKPPFERCVFVNRPFDARYLPLPHAMLFAIDDCGFVAGTDIRAGAPVVGPLQREL
jgi:hypothetical protein